jgi:flagellar hook-associated protein 3 FlgL
MISGSAYNLQAEINRQTALSTSIAQLQTDISTGVKVHVSSDDPVAAAQIAQLRTTQADSTVYSSNIDSATATTGLIDDNLGSVQTAMDRVKELVLAASNGTQNADDRTVAVTQLQSILSEIQGYASQTDTNGQPLFTTGTPLAVPIGRGQTVAANDSYDAVFGGVTLKDGSTSSVADVINGAIAALNANDTTKMTTSLDNIDAATTHITDARADVGIRETQLKTASDTLATFQTNLADQRQGLEDTDVTTAYATLTAKMTTLSAAQTVLSQLSQNTLFDKLS